MQVRAGRYRHSWRLRVPVDPGETRRIERWLATARVFLAVSALVAIRMDPTQLGNSWAAYGLFVFYLANGILILMLLRRRLQSTASFRLLVHAGDVAWQSRCMNPDAQKDQKFGLVYKVKLKPKSFTIRAKD